MTGGNAGTGLYQAPAIIANDTYAYAASDFECCGGFGAFSGYRLGSNGEMQNWTFNMSDNVSPVNYARLYVTADPTNHLAAILASEQEESFGPAQLASYTVDRPGEPFYDEYREKYALPEGATEFKISRLDSESFLIGQTSCCGRGWITGLPLQWRESNYSFYSSPRITYNGTNSSDPLGQQQPSFCAERHEQQAVRVYRYADQHRPGSRIAL